MGFSSLADELGDAFGHDEGVQGGRSLADEFGLDFGLDEEVSGDGSLDEVEDSLGGSPPTPNPLTPHLDISAPSTPTSHLSTRKPFSPSTHYTAEDLTTPNSPFQTPLSSSRPTSPSPPDFRQSLQKNGVSPRPPSIASRYTPKLERDPLVELDECMASTSRLIDGLKALHPSSSTAGLSTSSTITSLSSRSISSVGSHSTIMGLRGGELFDGDVVDRLAVYSFGMQQREKRLDERLLQLEGMMSRWEDVGYGSGMDLGLRDLIEGIGEEAERTMDGLPIPRSPGMSPLKHPELPTSPQQELNDPFSPPPRTRYQPLSDSTHHPHSISHHIADIHSDSLLPTLLILRETLHTHSSHTLGAQRQVRQIRGAIQGAKERDDLEDQARRGIEVWEARRVADGLKGVGGVRTVLDVEMKGFEEALGRFESEMTRTMGAVKGTYWAR